MKENLRLQDLSPGTKFLVTNGFWYGEVIKENGVKKVLTSLGNTFEVKEDNDLCIKIIDYSHEKMPLRENDKFRHYKGDIYNYLLEAKSHDTKEKFVIYSDSKGNVWTREKGEFFSKVKVDGEEVDRFKRLVYNNYI